MTEFKAVDNSTIYDVCLNTYGTLNLLGRLMTDNNFPGVETYPKAGQVFLFDETLVANQAVTKTNLLNGEKYATRRVIVPFISDFGEFTITTHADGNQSIHWVLSFDGEFNLQVDWGDGNIENFSDVGVIELTHEYITDSDFIAILSSENISKLVGIDLSNGDCQVTDVQNLEVCTGLIELRLDNNLFETFNPISALPNALNVLGLGNNQLTEFNPTIALPGGLETLILTNNQLTEFNPTIALPGSITSLALNSNSIAAFDTTLPLPTNLIELNLSNNELSEFNPSIALPSNLTDLDLSNNVLSSFDPSIALPVSVSTLLLTSNVLTIVEIPVPRPTAFELFRVDANEMTIANINQLLIDLDDEGYSVGEFIMNGQLPTGAPPEGLGQVAKDNLIGRGCTVTTDIP